MTSALKLKNLNTKKTSVKKNKFDEALMNLGYSEKEKTAQTKKKVAKKGKKLVIG